MLLISNFGIYLKHNLRLFIEAILYRIRTECPWRDLSDSFGKPNSIFKKFNWWSNDSKLLKIFKLLSNHAGLAWIFIDSSHVRAHQHVTGFIQRPIYFKKA
ncbi:transposase [Acinetobacter sp. 194]|nr:transposase [Acinetobacter shaoyimingii]